MRLEPDARARRRVCRVDTWQFPLSDHFEIRSHGPSGLAAAAVRVLRMPDCQWQPWLIDLHWAPSQAAAAWSSLPHWQAQSDHYEIQGGALVARAGPGWGGDWRVDSANWAQAAGKSHGRPKSKFTKCRCHVFTCQFACEKKFPFSAYDFTCEGRRFAAALLPRLFGTNPRSHYKGTTGRVQS